MRYAIDHLRPDGRRDYGGLAVIIPTVPGREGDLELTTAAFEWETFGVRIYPQTGHESVGAGWRAGTERLVDLARETGNAPEFVLYGNDDMRPINSGWLVDAIEASDQGFTPCPVMWRPDGSVESAGAWQAFPVDWRRVDWTPLCWFRFDEYAPVAADPAKAWGPMPDLHYYSDNYFATASELQLGRPIVVREAFAFEHTWAMPGRRALDGPEAKAHRKVWEAFRDEQLAARRRRERMGER